MIRRPLILLAACLPGAALPAAPAQAFDVSPQAEIRPPKRFPAALPGGFRAGERIPRGHVLLRRSIAITRADGRRDVTFRCPGGRRVRTIGANDPSPVGLGVDRDMRNYTRRSKLRLFVYAAPTLVERGELARGRVYVLCRPR